MATGLFINSELVGKDSLELLFGHQALNGLNDIAEYKQATHQLVL